MQKRTVKTEQLHLELQYDYLKWLNNASEEVDSYETTALRFFKTPTALIGIVDNPYWKELNNLSKRFTLS